MTVSKEVIARILTAFLALYQKDPELFNPKDVEMVQSNEWWIERFNETGDQNEEQVKRALIDTMEWRKTSGVLELKEEQFKSLIKRGKCSEY